MEKAHIANHYLQACIRGAERQGFGANDLLAAAEIPPAWLNQPSHLITEQQLARLIQNVWRCTRDEFMGLAPHPCPNGVFALMAEYCLPSHTLGALLRRSARFFGTVCQDVEIALEEHCEAEDGLLFFRLQLSDSQYDPDHLLQEFMLLMWQRFSSWLVGQQIPFAQTQFSYAAPQHASEYRLMYAGELRYNRPVCGFYLHARYLQLPIVRREAELAQFLRESPAYILHRPSHDDSYRAKVYTLLARHDYMLMPSQEEISSELNLTSRTLARKLKEEGTAYTHIKAALRREYAIKLLTAENFKVADISERLGFSEVASFCRAFKRWTGKTPSSWAARD